MRCSVKILMLVNWKVAYENQIPEGKQPPDYVVPRQKYWFFRYLSDDISVDVVDIRSFPWLERFEKEKIQAAFRGLDFYFIRNNTDRV